jgi:DNA polymerase I-like protein with 3'-5' exonuclease and polymerase domains
MAETRGAAASDPAEAAEVLEIFKSCPVGGGLAEVYARIDLPLIRVLAEMESTGISGPGAAPGVEWPNGSEMARGGEV